MLHTEEFEIILPDRLPPYEEQPVLLSIGPSLTMSIPIIIMALFGMKIYGTSGSFVYMMLVTGITGCVLGGLWGIANYVYRKKLRREKEFNHKAEFDRYLMETQDYLTTCSVENREYMYNRYPDTKTLLARVDLNHLFKRLKDDYDYGFVRISRGDIPFQMKLTINDGHKEMFPSVDRLKALDLVKAFRILSNVPVGIDINEKYIALQFNHNEKAYEYIFNMLIQVAYYFDPSKLRIALFYDESDEDELRVAQAVKWLPHFWLRDSSQRLICGSRTSMQQIIPVIENVLEMKRERLIILILNDELVFEENLIVSLFDEENKYDIGIWYLKNTRALPAVFKQNINVRDYKSLESIDFKSMDSFGRKLAALKIQAGIKDNEIPEKVDFFGLFDAGKPQDLGIPDRWNNNLPSKRMKTPIGLGAGKRKIYLDVHEKFHGPHGLIGGTTGSGKSELLQTYIVSLCVNFAPSLVNFLLIDYKGGGTGNKIDKLPHCAGIISNLSGSQIYRAIKSIRSENLRRQELLFQNGVNHIDDYQLLYRDGLVCEPMPHLIIIVDEFAELKKEEPQFIEEVISLAAVGRSLGIHLILATQKPAGVIDDKIWSNSNFKLCLKVQDKQDSMDMLHRPEAATLTNPGQCYLQIGNNEFFERFQTGYLGGKFTREEDETKVFMLSETGQRLFLKSENQNSNLPDKLELTVDFISQCADELNEHRAKSLWLEELSDYISLTECVDEVSRAGNSYDYQSEFVLGKYDNPGKQRQGVIFYKPCLDGHIAIAGAPSTGKTNLILTILYQTLETDDVLIVDMDSRNLSEGYSGGNLLGVLTSGDNIDIFCYHLNKEYEKHKNSKDSKRLIIFIDNFGLFYKSLSEREQDFLTKMISDGLGINIYFVITGNGITDFTQKIFNKIRTTMCLEMTDVFQYGEITRKYRMDTYPKSNTAGRCLYKNDDEWLECQCAVPDYSWIEQHKKSMSDKACDYLVENRFPHVPLKPTYEEFISEVTEGILMGIIDKKYCIPIGYSLKTGYVRGIDLRRKNSFLVSGMEDMGGCELIREIEMTIMSLGLVAPEAFYSYRAGDKIDYRALENSRILLIEDIRSFVVTESEKLPEQNLVDRMDSGFCEDGLFVIAYYNPQKDSDLIVHPLYRRLCSDGQGIHLGGNVSVQRALDFGDLSFSISNSSLPDKEGFMRLSGRNKTLFIRIPQIKEEKADDYD